MYNNDKCKDCKFFRRLKHNFKRGEGFEESYCCVAWEYAPDEGKGHTEPWIQEVGPLSLCEMYTPKDRIKTVL